MFLSTPDWKSIPVTIKYSALSLQIRSSERADDEIRFGPVVFHARRFYKLLGQKFVSKFVDGANAGGKADSQEVERSMRESIFSVSSEMPAGEVISMLSANDRDELMDFEQERLLQDFDLDEELARA
eukprot:c14696_g1_i2.p4 GENE.c14696_g1_i2~~c14696_g1_i2.p4  ORF type:complete len:127 (+),score=30.36 c14696_g1_i2:716-1096(+)